MLITKALIKDYVITCGLRPSGRDGRHYDGVKTLNAQLTKTIKKVLLKTPKGTGAPTARIIGASGTKPISSGCISGGHNDALKAQRIETLNAQLTTTIK